MKYLLRLKNPITLAATISNIIAILLLLGINPSQLDTAQKIATLVIQIFIQVGILNNANE